MKINMNYKVAQQLIPGYETLNPKQLTAFSKTESGKLFDQTVFEIDAIYQSLKKSSFFFRSYEIPLTEQQEKTINTKKQLLNTINNDPEYYDLIQSITFNLLDIHSQGFKLLERNDQLDLANDTLSQEIFSDIQVLHYQLDDAADFKIFEQLTQKKLYLLNKWYLHLDTTPEFAAINTTIKSKVASYMEEQFNKLANIFPLLNLYSSIEQDSSLDQLIAQLSYFSTSSVESYKGIAEEELTQLIFNCLMQLNKDTIPFINLKLFNFEQANRLAKSILDAFNNQQVFDKKQWLFDYETALAQYLFQQFLTINGKKWTPPPETSLELFKLFSEGLSYIFAYTKDEKSLFKKLSDAHAFIQMTGGATQNENSYLAILDLFNYYQYYEQINETKQVIFHLLSPFVNIYYEYKAIALLEKNMYWKLYRSLMPIIITATVIITVAALLAPLAIPEIAFTFALIPALIFGLALSSKYISLKDKCYKYIRQTYYGGAFEIPEFQINERLLKAFPSKEIAENVRQFYVDELKKCDEIELNLDRNYKKGCLTEQEIQLKKENLKRRHTLCLEWYDIHSNFNLSYEAATQLAINRFKIESNDSYKLLQKTLKKESGDINLIAQQFTHQINEFLEKNDQIINDSTPIEKTLITYSPRLFDPPPHCLEIKNKLEKEELLLRSLTVF